MEAFIIIPFFANCFTGTKNPKWPGGFSVSSSVEHLLYLLKEI